MDRGWFLGSQDYWETQEATVDGMLGGLGNLSSIDISTSKRFLTPYFPRFLQNGHALDCGAGIGRISKDLLLSIFGRVSLLESNEKFCAKARELVPADRLEAIFTIRMSEYRASLSKNRYDLVWIQWVIIYNSDEELVVFLKEAKLALKPGGYIGLKDNTLPSEAEPEYDEDDCSVTRSTAHLERLFKLAGLAIVEKQAQARFPKNLYPIWMYLLR